MSKGTLDIILITFFCGIIIRFKLDWYVDPHTETQYKERKEVLGTQKLDL